MLFYKKSSVNVSSVYFSETHGQGKTIIRLKDFIFQQKFHESSIWHRDRATNLSKEQMRSRASCKALSDINTFAFGLNNADKDRNGCRHRVSHCAELKNPPQYSEA